MANSAVTTVLLGFLCGWSASCPLDPGAKDGRQAWADTGKVGSNPEDSQIGANNLVARLDFARFKLHVRTLADFRDRTQGTQGNRDAMAWLERQLREAGYTPQRHAYSYYGAPRDNLYATKVGTVHPEEMYIVSAHMDGRGGGGAADDDASGTALVLQCAQALGSREVNSARSIRFIFWNNEETGLNGSTAYVQDRRLLQGVETPPGSGQYPEPRWLGLVQHDMILFDHGLPPQAEQIPGADIDVEYQRAAVRSAEGRALALELVASAQAHSTDYPAEMGDNMRNTDSYPFRDFTAAVSVRENQRIAEIGNGANPHWHRRTDVYSSYSEKDFRLGFNAMQMTLGAVAKLAGVTVP